MDIYTKQLIDYALNYNYERDAPKGKIYELEERRRVLNDQFIFNESNVKRIDKINRLLTQKQLEVFEQTAKFERLLQKEIEIEDTFTDDYEVDFNIHLFAENKFQQFEDMIGNSFYQFKAYMGFIKGEYKDEVNGLKESYFTDNHNMYQWKPDHPLRNQHHCYLLHFLYDHTILAWQDIIDIEEIWVEIELTIQNFSEVK